LNKLDVPVLTRLNLMVRHPRQC